MKPVEIFGMDASKCYSFSECYLFVSEYWGAGLKYYWIRNDNFNFSLFLYFWYKGKGFLVSFLILNPSLNLWYTDYTSIYSIKGEHFMINPGKENTAKPLVLVFLFNRKIYFRFVLPWWTLSLILLFVAAFLYICLLKLASCPTPQLFSIEFKSPRKSFSGTIFPSETSDQQLYHTTSDSTHHTIHQNQTSAWYEGLPSHLSLAW